MDHQPPSIQISPGQLQNELESIRSLRRISLSQPSSDLDPDLPSTLQIDSPPSSIINSNNQSLSPPLSQSDSNSESVQPQDQPHPDLFWLPARLHPEIAPREFKAFIEEATKPENLLRRTSSALGSRRPNSNDFSNPSSVTRKKSMLSKVYHPTEHDLHSLPSQPRSDAAVLRGYSMSSPNHMGRGPRSIESLTINDLQKLESLVLRKPSQHSPSDPNIDSELQTLNLYDHRIKNIISRSLSLGGNHPAPLNDSDSSKDQPDSEAIDDSPLISRAPGHIIRRTARTKVRKPLLPGDGNGHRFAATRRTQVKNPMLTTSPAAVSTTSNTSEETLSTDLHSNRNSNEYIQKPNQSIPSQPTSSDDPLGGTSDSDATLTIDSKLLPQRPPLQPISGTKSSQSSSLDGSSHQYPPSSEEDQSISSASRPDSVISNSSLLDAYAYENAASDDHSTTINFNNFDMNKPSIPNPNIDLVTQNQLKSEHPLPVDHRQLLIDAETLQTPTSNSMTHPSFTNNPFLSYPGASKPEGLNLVTDTIDPPSVRTSLSSDDLLSTSTLVASTVKSSSPSTIPSSSPQNPVSSTSSRPSLTTIRTSPNLTTPSNTINPSPSISTTNTNPPTPPSSSTKEIKEKKRTWVKLGLASAVSPSSKSKKEKGKDKQKAKGDTLQTNDGSSGTSSNSAAAQSGGNNNAPTTGAKKESGFLSGLFGGKSKKQDSEQDKQNSSANQSTANTKSHSNSGSSLEIQGQQQLINPTASGGYIKGRFMSFYRLPIHVERAVYRLSHIKLANPRRPLYEQVLISNLMFWYLGVINKTQSTPHVSNQPQSIPAAPSPVVPPLPSPHNNNKHNHGNSRSGKSKSTKNSNSSNQQQKRGPGMKKNWDKNQRQEPQTSSNVAGGSSSSSNAAAANKEWVEPDSSDSSGSEREDQPVERRRKRKEGGPTEQKRSSSSLSSSASTNSSSDDDEKPLGSRMGLSKQMQFNQSSSAPNSSPVSTNNSPKSSQVNNNRNVSGIPPDRDHTISYNSRANLALVKPQTNGNLILGFVNGSPSTPPASGDRVVG